MSTLPSILDILILRIKDRHHACPEVNCIIHPTSILYGTRIIISLVMHLRNLSEQTETAVWYPAISSGRFHAVLVRMECSHEFREGIHMCEIYIRGGQGNYESPFQDKDILSFYFYFCNSPLGHREEHQRTVKVLSFSIKKEIISLIRMETRRKSYSM